MKKQTSFSVGSLVRIDRGGETINVIIEKTGNRKSLGRVDQIRYGEGVHGFNQGDVITFLNTEVIEVLEFSSLKRFLELAVESFTRDWESAQHRAGKYDLDE